MAETTTPLLSGWLAVCAAGLVGGTAVGALSGCHAPAAARSPRGMGRSAAHAGGYPGPRPKYAKLVPPTCRNTRDEHAANACWRELPSQGGKFVRVSASCGITGKGRVQCWKDLLAHTPKGTFAVVDDDGRDACAASAGGGVVCWGRDPWPDTPRAEKFCSLSVGGDGPGETSAEFVNACGLTARRTVVCWGDGEPGWRGHLRLPGPYTAVGLGDGWVDALTPDGHLEKRVASDSVYTERGPFKTFSEHSEMRCRVWRSGRVKCDGWGLFHLLRAHPPSDLGPIRMIRNGANHACALQMDGRVRCWGDFRPPPKLKFKYISQPDMFDDYCGITLSGDTYCWGDPSRRPKL